MKQNNFQIVISDICIYIYMYIYIYYIHTYIDGNTNYLLFWPVLPQWNLTSSFVHSLYLHWIGKQHWGGSFLALVFNNLLWQLTISCKEYELLGNVTFSRSTVNIQNRILVWVNKSYHLFGKMWIFVLVKNIHKCLG